MFCNLYIRKKLTIFSFSLSFLFLFLGSCGSPVSFSEDYSEINIFADPLQISHEKGKPIVKEMEDCTFTVTPVASYKISAMVAGKKFYSDGWRAKVAPVDLALVWGKLTEPEYDRHITYSQGDRWYYYQYTHGSPFNNSYVINHSSNNHIIPANKNILMAIKTITKREKVVLEGYLVNVCGSYRGGTFWWNSSLTRSDTGDGSCEVFYVAKIRIENKVYE